MALLPRLVAGETEAQIREGASKGTGDSLAKLLPGPSASRWGHTLGFRAPSPGPAPPRPGVSAALQGCRFTERQSRRKWGAGGPPSWSGAAVLRGRGAGQSHWPWRLGLPASLSSSRRGVSDPLPFAWPLASGVSVPQGNAAPGGPGSPLESLLLAGLRGWPGVLAVLSGAPASQAEGEGLPLLAVAWAWGGVGDSDPDPRGADLVVAYPLKAPAVSSGHGGHESFWRREQRAPTSALVTFGSGSFSVGVSCAASLASAPTGYQ